MHANGERVAYAVQLGLGMGASDTDTDTDTDEMTSEVHTMRLVKTPGRGTPILRPIQ